MTPHKTLPPFPLDPPLDTPKRASTHALIRFICLPTKLKLVHLERTKQSTRRQSKRYLCRASGAWVRVCARKCALQHRGASRGSRRQGPAERPTRRHVRPFAAACHRAARSARRARTEVQLDCDVI